MIEILIVASSAMLGIICALFVFQIIKKRKESRSRILGNVKYELSSLYFEKSVALEALNKINQQFDEKKIDEYERDRLSHKYVNLLDDYDKRAFQLNPILEVQEIYEYRNQLNSILSDYVKKIDKKLSNLGLSNNESNFKDKDKDKNHLDSFLKQTTSILDKIKTIKSSYKKNNESFSQVESDSDNKRELGFSIEEGLKEIGGSINDLNREHSQMNNEDTGTTSIPLDLKQSNNRNIDLNEIDKIQNDILKTLKRLGDS
jgi:methyl-accepting chemotaxis protein